MTADTILARVASAFSVTPADLSSGNRRRHITDARQAACVVLKAQLPRYSLVSIGKLLGNLDHSTVVHALRTVAERRTRDLHLDRLLKELEADDS